MHYLRKAVSLACLAACSITPLALAQSQQELDDRQRARDRSTYTLSLSLPPMRAMCAALNARYGAQFDAASPPWREANQQAIARGRKETAASLVGRSIEDYEADAASIFAKDLAALEKARKKVRCEGTLKAMTPSP